MRAPIRSPCVQVCYLDPDSGLCMGCFRTADEIGAWSMLSDEKRDEIMSVLTARRLLVGPEKFGEA